MISELIIIYSTYFLRILNTYIPLEYKFRMVGIFHLSASLLCFLILKEEDK